MHAIKVLLQDLAQLVTGKNGKLASYLLVALVLQCAYWYLGSPGPQLFGDANRTLGASVINIGWSVLLLFLLPLGLMLLLRDSPKKAGLRFGDVCFGFSALLLAVPVAVLLMFFGAQSDAIQATYPWAGDWVGRTIFNLLLWAALYALYYLSFEFFYRGFMLSQLQAHWGLSAAIWVQTIASTLIHLGKPLPETLAAIPAGLLFGVLAARSKSILYPFLLHLAIGLSTDAFSLYHQGLLF